MRSFITGCLFLLTLQAQAQKGVNSLYSAFGIGDLEEKDYSRSFGVGSAGIARGSDNFLNELNPASYSRLPMETFFFEASVAGKTVQYNTSTSYQTAGDISFKRFALGFKAHKRWGMSLGLMPYSRVDYKLLNTRTIDGTGSSVRNAVEGSGGINRLYFSNAVQLTKNFSLGVSSALLFGPVSTTDSLGGGSSSEDVYSEVNNAYRSFEFNTGLQYHGKVGEWQLGAGVTYRLKSQLVNSQDFSLKAADGTVLYTETRKAVDYTLPEQLGAGIHISNGQLAWLMDYRQQNWQGLNPNRSDYQYITAKRYAGGMEYTFYRDYFNVRMEGLILQAGVNYSTGYLRVKGEPLSDFGVTAGASLPSRTGHLRYYIGLEGGQRGRAVKGLVKENYLNVVLHLSLRDNWFFKRKEL
ncbi:hypothetical protein [Chitinophaga alhagiae]|uniref:hypothetical protein n=1 Tax=Chitinophaga alhagiae TaxID=2203219 RepID=UPI000E5BD6E6|nr:hypothetical protein [Chitinophaga alhagiae]